MYRLYEGQGEQPGATIIREAIVLRVLIWITREGHYAVFWIRLRQIARQVFGCKISGSRPEV